MTRLAIFDCDGTLVDSAAAICEAMEQGFTAYGLPAPDRLATRRVVGLSLYEAMQRLHPAGDEALHRALAEAYKAAFHRLRGEQRAEEPLFDGIVETLDVLAAEGWLLGVATGKSDRGLRLCLDRHGIRARFVTLQTADRHPSKPHPAMLLAAMAEAGAAPEQTAMIGDTSFDMGAAAAAGVLPVGVAWGYHAADELLAEGAARVAVHPGELPAILKELA